MPSFAALFTALLFTSLTSTILAGPISPVPLAAAVAPGILNSLGKGQDPAPLTLDDGTYAFPDIDFNTGVFIRLSDTLQDVQNDPSKMHKIFTFPTNIVTEAPDLSEYQCGYAMYISSIADNLIHVIQSDSMNITGDWNLVGVVNDPTGKPISGYDPHVMNYPNGKRYLTYSTLSAVQVVELTDLVTTQGNIMTIASNSDKVTEAPSHFFCGNTVNVAFATGSYQDQTYSTNIATLTLDQDPTTTPWVLNPNNPVIASDADSGVFGPGSGGFFVGPDKQTWFAYGAFSDPDGFHNGPNIRTIRAQRITPDANGVMQPVAAVKATAPVPDNGGNI